MKTKISSTTLVRQFGDCLARVKYRGEAFVITKNEEEIAELAPLGTARGAKWSELASALSSLPVDPGFADDLEEVNESDTAPENPWG